MDDTLAAALGQRLRRLRQQSGRGLREQARDIGISASSLSALENSRGGVSLQRLQQVAGHFGLHITDLLAEEPAENGDDFLPDPEVVRSWATSVPGVERGSGVIYQLMGHGGSHAIQPYLISFPPGASYRDDPIAHEGEEFAYVILGEIELALGDHMIQLRQGDVVRFRTEEPHAFRNRSTVGMAMLIGAATPPW
jgi:transcriptional regulator with XRE-family HTH domain